MANRRNGQSQSGGMCSRRKGREDQPDQCECEKTAELEPEYVEEECGCSGELWQSDRRDRSDTR